MRRAQVQHGILDAVVVEVGAEHVDVHVAVAQVSPEVGARVGGHVVQRRVERGDEARDLRGRDGDVDLDRDALGAEGLVQRLAVVPQGVAPGGIVGSKKAGLALLLAERVGVMANQDLLGVEMLGPVRRPLVVA